MINEQIRDREVRVIGADGEQLGIMSARDAQKLANEANLDLVKIAPTAKPPVCKIIDYGKYRYEMARKEKEAKKNQRVIEIKEIRMSPGIDTNDFNTKLKNAQKFLADGDRVKVSVRFRGREMAHTDIGAQLLRDFAAKCSEIANMDKPPKLEGRHMSMFLVPKTQKELKKDAKEAINTLLTALREAVESEDVAKIYELESAINAAWVGAEVTGGGGSNTISLGWGTYKGSVSGSKSGIGGEITVNKTHTIDLKKASGETVTVNPGDKIANAKVENGQLRQGEIRFADGTRKFVSGL